MINIPRSEHPRPDLYREAWMNLNGKWEFEIDNEVSGFEKGYAKRTELSSSIILPFCPESKLSGIGHTDFMNAVWYRRDVQIPEDWAGKKILLHIGASDYSTEVFVNGAKCGRTHHGGYTPFTVDITDKLVDGKGSVTVYAVDDTRSKSQVSGKQCVRLNSYGCYYTRTTGIWQTVWLEAVPKAHVVRYNAVSDVENGSVSIDVLTEGAMGAELLVEAFYEGRKMGEGSTRVAQRSTRVGISLAEKHLWELGAGRLYDLVIALKGEQTDVVKGYFGLREVALDRGGFLINGKRVYGRFVLDQGFYPDGIYTAPTDEALIFDIEASMKLGFNGARLHQKVFEPRFLYHADRLGYMVFCETGNWGLDHTDPMKIYNFLPEWQEEVERDMAHPSVIGWCPFNETWDKDGRRQSNEFIELVYDLTHAIDPTRPVVTNSGSFPCRSDLYDIHDYEQDPETFRANYSRISEGVVNCQLMRRYGNSRMHYSTEQPVFVSEYGGIKWVLDEDSTAWGYGKSVTTEDEFLQRLEGLTDVLLENKDIIAYCYTQLTDVEQEQNGLLTYDRRFKFAPEKIHPILSKKAVIED